MRNLDIILICWCVLALFVGIVPALILAGLAAGGLVLLAVLSAIQLLPSDNDS